MTKNSLTGKIMNNAQIYYEISNFDDRSNLKELNKKRICAHNV